MILLSYLESLYKKITLDDFMSIDELEVDSACEFSMKFCIIIRTINFIILQIKYVVFSLDHVIFHLETLVAENSYYNFVLHIMVCRELEW